MDWTTIATDLWSGINAAFMWDGWRAIAALGTTAAVVVALNRDSAAERASRMKAASLISAVLDCVTVLDKSLEVTTAQKTTKVDLAKEFRVIEQMDLVADTQTLLDSIRIKDLPTVECMTTITVLRTSVRHIGRLIAECKPERVTGLGGSWVSLKTCIRDLETERAHIAGRDLDRTTNDGHRKVRDRKMNGSLRLQSLKALPGIFATVVTGRPTKPAPKK